MSQDTQPLKKIRPSIPCTICKKKYGNTETAQVCFIKHLTNEESEDNHKFACPICKKRFVAIVDAHNCYLGHAKGEKNKSTPGKTSEPYQCNVTLQLNEAKTTVDRKNSKEITNKKPTKLTAAHCLVCFQKRRSAKVAEECCAEIKKIKHSHHSSASEYSQKKVPQPTLPTTSSTTANKTNQNIFANQCCVCSEMKSSANEAKQCCSKEKRHADDDQKLLEHLKFGQNIVASALTDHGNNYVHNDDNSDEESIELHNVSEDDNAFPDDSNGQLSGEDEQRGLISKRKHSDDDCDKFVTGHQFKKLKSQIAKLTKKKQKNHVFRCGRCDRVFVDRAGWRQHDIMCIVSSGLMENSPTVRQTVIDAIVGRWPKETAMGILAKVAHQGNVGPLQINATPSQQRIYASTANVSAQIEELPLCKFLFHYLSLL